jgi:hypothetical protein
MRPSTTRICTTILIVMISMSYLECAVDAQTPLDPIVVLLDASHSPHFAAGDATDGLKLMLDMVNASTRYVVRVHSGSPINDTVLRGVDVLIVASPGKSSAFTNSEAASIGRLLNNGSSLMILGDPAIAQNSSYWSETTLQDLGSNIVINRLLDLLNITGVRFSINATGGDTFWADCMFDYTHVVNKTSPWVIKMDSTTWDTGHPIFKDINELVLMAATLKPVSLVSSIARGYKTSFAQFRKGPNTFANTSFPNMTLEEFHKWPLNYSAINGTLPPWLSAFEYNGSRIVISGSTIMFTGRVLDVYKGTLKWFYTADNARLFMNMLSWLTEGFVQPETAILPMVAFSSVVFIIGVVIYTIKKRKQ